VGLLTLLAGVAPRPVDAQDASPARLVAALVGDTPLVHDLEILTDEIGGRAGLRELQRRR
jgi:hypothetical protein